ncbi:MAG: MATE family efflux transporter [Butyrivibrio sp.]|nr:MATE family efflux transporter [Butyrivibrio sp.]
MKTYDRTKENKEFFSLLALTVLPLLIQSIFTQSINFIDQIMVSSLGTETIAAIGASNKLLSLYNAFLYGSGSGCAMFMAQYWGANDHEGFKKILGVLLTITLSMGIIFSLLVMSIPTQLILIFNDDPVVVALGVEYMRAVVPAYFLMSIIFPLEYMLRSMNKVRVTMTESIFSVLINCFANYTFIFGKFGCPKLGVTGAALGTVLCRIASIVVLIIYIVISKNEIMRNPLKLFTYDFSYVKAFVKRAVPLIGNEMMWNLGTTIYFIIYGRAGTDALAAMSIMQTLQMLAKIASGGFCGASTIIIGNEIGKGDIDKVKRYCDKFHITAFIVGIVSGLVIYTLRTPMLAAYSIDGTVVGDYVSKCMVILSFYIFLNCNNNINVEGIFRSGGDIAYLTLMDMGSIWFVGMPLTLITGALGFNVVVIYAAYIVLELYKLPLGYVRYKSGKWLHLLYKETVVSDAA